MKTSQKQWTVFLLALTSFAASALAVTPTLKIGDPAPKLQNGQYVQGDPVKEFEPGKAYIVEFWATWCGPCKASIPHLNDIYTKYKDKGLVVIGQDCWERDDKLVAPFIKTMGDTMTYRIALDDKSAGKPGKMAETWMEAAGQNGIPTAFLIDQKGLVAWIGHPMLLEEKQDIIDQVLAGKYDVAKAAADYAKELVAQAEQEKKAAPLESKLKDVSKAMQEKKWDEALEDLAAAEKLVPENQRSDMAVNLDMNRFTILIRKKDYPAAYKLALKISDAHKDNAMVENLLAWQIITDKTIEKPDLDVAKTLADRANEAAKGKDGGIMDTQARVLFMKGQKEEAIAVETKAVAIADADMKQSLQSSLDSYKKGVLPDAE